MYNNFLVVQAGLVKRRIKIIEVVYLGLVRGRIKIFPK